MQEKVLIVGAGPVGLLAANFLARAGISTLIIDQRSGPIETSRAIGITPPSLDIMRVLGLEREFLAQGVKISQVEVHSHRRLLGRVSFAKVPSYPYILSLPQVQTETILRKSLGDYPSVRLLWDTAWAGFAPKGSLEDRISILKGPGGEYTQEFSYILACDGSASRIRQSLNLDYTGVDYPYTFLMGDFDDRTSWGFQARLFFTPWGAVESFPMPQGQRRWIVQTRSFQTEPPGDFISRTVLERTGLEIGQENPHWQSPFGVKRKVLKNFHQKGLFFLGDAAHIMSPIGGQGMNTGFKDVADLVPALAESLTTGAPLDQGFIKIWNRARKSAFRIAADRAWRGMFLGVQTGTFRSLLRNIFLWIMLGGPWKGRIPLDYAMRTIPQDPRLRR